LETYKEQYGIESDFGFLKDPIIVNDIFLKKPHRIEVLGMILIIALMIWRLMERTMRENLQNSNSTVIGWEKRKTAKTNFFYDDNFHGWNYGCANQWKKSFIVSSKFKTN